MVNKPAQRAADTLGDEAFMTAEELRKYMNDMALAKAGQEVSAMDRADAARKELIDAMKEKVDLTPQKSQEIMQRLSTQLKAAAQRGESEVMVMRFPNDICTDKGRAINNYEAGWPDTLTGRPRQAYEFWKEHLQPQKYRLSAAIIDWPGGLPGDVALFVSWA